MIPQTAAPTVLRFLRCVVAQQSYCLTMASVSGIQRLERFRRQSEKDGLVGQLDSQPDATPVVSLAARLALPGMDHESTGKIVMLKAQPHPWGLLVDDVEGVIQVAVHDLLPLPALARPRIAAFFDAMVPHDNTFLLSLSPAGLHPQGSAYAASFSPPFPSPPSSAPPAPGAHGQIVCFRTADTPVQRRPLLFALSLSQVVQILHAPPLLPVPGAPTSVLGLVQWRAYPLAVIDLSQRLGGPASAVRPNSRLLVARAASTHALVGFPIQPDICIRRLPLAHRPSDPQVLPQASLIRGQFDLDRETLVIPDIDGILMPQENQPC
jgi:chemotaxis signal transduction protein